MAPRFGKTERKRNRKNGVPLLVPAKLAKRIKLWQEIPKASMIQTNVKVVDGMAYRKPGSQNPRKS